MNELQKQALVNVLNFLADEESNYHNETDQDMKDFHIWNDREILREMFEQMEKIASPKVQINEQQGGLEIDQSLQ